MELRPLSRLLQAVRQVGHLADRRNDHVAIKHEFRALDRHRHIALHAAFAHAQANCLALFVLDDFKRHDRALDLDAFPFRVLAFAFGGGHLLDREQRGENGGDALALERAGDVVSGIAELARRGRRVVMLVRLADMAETARHRSDVDRGVAAADHDDFFRCREKPAAVERIEEFDASDAIDRIASGNRQGPALLRADRPEHRVVVLVEIFHRRCRGRRARRSSLRRRPSR